MIKFKGAEYRTTSKAIDLQTIGGEMRGHCETRDFALFMYYLGVFGCPRNIWPTLQDISDALNGNRRGSVRLSSILVWLEDHGYVTKGPVEKTFQVGQRFKNEHGSIYTLIPEYNGDRFGLMCNGGAGNSFAHSMNDVKNPFAIKLSEVSMAPENYEPID